MGLGPHGRTGPYVRRLVDPEGYGIECDPVRNRSQKMEEKIAKEIQWK